jgi:hypothetical protein
MFFAETGVSYRLGIVCEKLPNYKTKPCIGRKGYNGKIMTEFDNS